MAYNPYRASYGLPPPILPSAGKPVPQGMAPMQPPPLPPLQAPLRIQNPEPNMSRQKKNLNSSIGSSNRSAVSILSANFRLEDQLTNGNASNKQQREAMIAFDPQRIREIKEIKGSRRAQQMVSSALAAAGGTSPAALESSSPARTVSSNPPSKNGSTDSLFGGLSPIAKVDDKRKRKTRKIKRSRKSQKQLKNRKYK